MSGANRSRNSRRLPLVRCEVIGTDRPCEGREHVVLVTPEGHRKRVCPRHGADLWLSNPAWHFGAETRPGAIAAVLRQAFGGPR